MNNHFENLPYRADELSAYVFSIDTFVIGLKNGKVVRYVAEDPEAFIAWLSEIGVRNINDEVGSMVYDHYFP